MKDYSFYIIIAYSFCFLSLIILTILSKVFLSDSKKSVNEIEKND
jgi:heme exporter protein D